MTGINAIKGIEIGESVRADLLISWSYKYWPGCGPAHYSGPTPPEDEFEVRAVSIEKLTVDVMGVEVPVATTPIQRREIEVKLLAADWLWEAAQSHSHDWVDAAA